MTKTETIILRVEPKLKKELQKLAEMDRRTLGDFIRLKLESLISKK